jgi:hypothetical protein
MKTAPGGGGDHNDVLQHYRRTAARQEQLDAWADTARDLLAAGTPPLVPLHICRALWRRGRGDRALALELARIKGAP